MKPPRTKTLKGMKLVKNQVLLTRDTAESISLGFGIKNQGFFWVEFNAHTMTANLRSSLSRREWDQEVIFEIGRVLLKTIQEESKAIELTTGAEFFWRFKKNPLKELEATVGITK